MTWQSETALSDLDAAWQAPNRSHGLRTYFTAAGIRVVPRRDDGPSWEWGLAWVGYGRGGTSWSVPAASLAPSGARIDYQRGGLSEWYENSPRGLKQGFVLDAPPEQWGRSVEGEPEQLGTVAPGRGRQVAAEHLVHVDLALSGIAPSGRLRGRARHRLRGPRRRARRPLRRARGHRRARRAARGVDGGVRRSARGRDPDRDRRRRRSLSDHGGPAGDEPELDGGGRAGRRSLRPLGRHGRGRQRGRVRGRDRRREPLRQRPDGRRPRVRLSRLGRGPGGGGRVDGGERPGKRLLRRVGRHGRGRQRGRVRGRDRGRAHLRQRPDGRRPRVRLPRLGRGPGGDGRVDGGERPGTRVLRLLGRHGRGRQRGRVRGRDRGRVRLRQRPDGRRPGVRLPRLGRGPGGGGRVDGGERPGQAPSSATRPPRPGMSMGTGTRT